MKNIKAISILGILLFSALVIFYYSGTYTVSYVSPNGRYEIRYYRVMKISIDVMNECRPYYWVRLYDKQGNKMNEVLQDVCALDSTVLWHNKSVYLADSETIWKLPESAGTTP